jgi:hypothetical protein
MPTVHDISENELNYTLKNAILGDIIKVPLTGYEGSQYFIITADNPKRFASINDTEFNKLKSEYKRRQAANNAPGSTLPEEGGRRRTRHKNRRTKRRHHKKRQTKRRH